VVQGNNTLSNQEPIFTAANVSNTMHKHLEGIAIDGLRERENKSVSSGYIERHAVNGRLFALEHRWVTVYLCVCRCRLMNELSVSI
jgi:hypothetical protein